MTADNQTTDVAPVSAPVAAPAPIQDANEPRVITFDEPEPVEVKPEVVDPKQADTTGNDADAVKEPKRGVQPRIDELTRARREAERNAEYWKQIATGQAQTSAPAAPQKPTQDQFKDFSEFVEALTDWKSERAAEKIVNARSEQDTARRSADDAAKTYYTRATEFAKTTPDFAEVVGAADVPLSRHVEESLTDSEFGPQLAYEFAKHPELLHKLNGMTPRAADREIGRIEASFVPKTAATPEVTKRVSQAPTPANTSARSGASTAQSLVDMPMDEFVKARAAAGSRWIR